MLAKQGGGATLRGCRCVRDGCQAPVEGMGRIRRLLLADRQLKRARNTTTAPRFACRCIRCWLAVSTNHQTQKKETAAPSTSHPVLSDTRGVEPRRAKAQVPELRKGNRENERMGFGWVSFGSWVRTTVTVASGRLGLETFLSGEVMFVRRVCRQKGSRPEAQEHRSPGSLKAEPHSAPEQLCTSRSVSLARLTQHHHHR